MSKYYNRKTIVDDITFASAREAKRYAELKLLVRGGVIKDLTLQPRFTLQESFKDARGETHRKIEYVADFSYVEDGKVIVEDVKGMKTDLFKLKLKLFLYKFRDFVFITT